ncbi:MAG: glycosyltransferase [Deltaproteobacteria bacterium]|nr:glycosyltransferase [Deltaproteobacteria bacterium]
MGTILFMVHFRSRSQAPKSSSVQEPVSILKPLKGVDSGLRENLQSFFSLDYPKFELIFSVADARDPACRLIEDLMDKNPGVDARLIIGAVEVGPNPKVNNMMRGYHQAKYDVTLISDSNVRVPANYLTVLMPDLDDETGVVSAVVSGQAPQGLGGRLEATFVNTFYARWMILGSALGFPMVIGKSMLFRRSVSARFGGIQNLSKFLAEDFMAGQAMMHLGLKIKHMRIPCPQVIGKHSFSDFWNRHVRWGRMRKVQSPLALFFEPVNGPIVSGLLGAFAAHKLFGVAFGTFFAAHVGFWFLNDLVVMSFLGAEIPYATPLFWLLREATSIPHWMHILSGNTVLWRGAKLKLQPGGTLAEPASAVARTA